MGGKCSGMKSKGRLRKDTVKKGNDKAINMPRRERSLKYREIKELHPKSPALSLRTELMLSPNESFECLTPKWGC